MGFDREDIIPAMRAAMNDMSLTIEFLMNGIPSHLMHDNDDDPNHDPDEEPQPHPQNMTTNEQAHVLQQFLASEQFQNQRQATQEDPNVITVFLEQLEQTNPEIYAVDFFWLKNIGVCE